MQRAVALSLTFLYVGLSLTLGGSPLKSGFPWWFFVPVIVVFCASLIAQKISTALPLPWAGREDFGAPPRKVRLSWRSAVRIPASVPVFIIPWHFFSILRFHFAIGWTFFILGPLIAGVLALIVRRRGREIRLLRHGEIALGVVDSHTNMGDGPERISYHFMTAAGTTVSARGWDSGYDVRPGSRVPVYYDADHPELHVVACSSWFEAD